MKYAIEARRRIKEQMNKRKSDDEFSKINLSFISKDDSEIVVYCPESKAATATQEPARKNIHGGELIEPPITTMPADTENAELLSVENEDLVSKDSIDLLMPELKEQTLYYSVWRNWLQL